MTASSIYIERGNSPAQIKAALLAVMQQAAYSGLRFTLHDGTILIQRTGAPAEQWQPMASIEQYEVPQWQTWTEVPPEARVDSEPGDTVRCPHHDAPAAIRWNDSAVVRALHEDGDKAWALDCGHSIHVKP